jgi:hypothetical protein
MKKIFVLVFTVSFICAAVSAFAWGHWGKGGGEGGCPCPKGEYNGEGGIGSGPDIGSFGVDDANAIIENTLKPNYKGYTFGEVESFATPRGFNIYLVRVADASGNKFVFFFGPRGHAKGPFLESELPAKFN